MKGSKYLLLFFTALLLCILTPPQTVRASEATPETDTSHYAQVFDDAGLFTPAQLEDLTAACQKVTDEYKIDVIFLTAPDVPGTRTEYLEDYYDSRDTELSDSVLLLLNMDPNDRGIEAQGYGSCETYFPDSRLSAIIDTILPYLKEGNYFQALTEFANQLDYCLNQDAANASGQGGASSPASGRNHVAVSATPVRSPVPHGRNLLIALIVAAISVAIMFYHSSGRMSTHQGTYLDSSNSRILGRYDRYIRTVTSRRPKPKPPESGGSSGGISSGGNSHSGSGSSF